MYALSICSALLTVSINDGVIRFNAAKSSAEVRAHTYMVLMRHYGNTYWIRLIRLALIVHIHSFRWHHRAVRVARQQCPGAHTHCRACHNYCCALARAYPTHTHTHAHARTITCTQVVAADVSVGNGRAVLHVIDRVLLPADLSLPVPADLSLPVPYVNVAAAARAAGLTTLLAAVTASDPGFLSVVNDPNFQGTVLAPSVRGSAISQAQLVEARAND